MPRLIALLRAINVGGHVVRMEVLRTVFEGMGFADVATFIASGNVVFSTDDEDTRALEGRIEQELRAALGYDSSTFLRSPAELLEIARHQAFSEVSKEGSLNVVFLRRRPSAELRRKLLALASETDSFQVHGREVYWLARKGTGQSPATGPLLKLVGPDGTTRGLNTVRRLADRYRAVE